MYVLVKLIFPFNILSVSLIRLSCRVSVFLLRTSNYSFHRRNYLIVVVQSDGLKVLQFPQIPQFQRAILGTWSTMPEKDVWVFKSNKIK